MVSRVETEKSSNDRFLWGLILLLVFGAVAGYYYFSAQSLLLRIVGILVSFGIAVAIAFQTKKGRAIWVQWLEAIAEVRKMVWPTRKETFQTTLAVMAMVVVMGILLWTADFILLRAVAWLTGNWGT